MTDQPLVSVVMAVCNAERYLTEAIQSIVDQTFRNLELVVVDYGSTDHSISIVSDCVSRDNRIRLLEIPPCVLPAARNAGCYRARGRYIAIMDADDIALRDRLDREVAYMEAHPQAALLGGGVEFVDSLGKSLLTHRHPTDDREIRRELLTHSVFWHPTIIMRREAFVAVGGYRPVFVCAHDYDLAVRIAEQYECANLDEVVLRYRFHAGQLSTEKQRLQTLCVLATRASAAARRNGQSDPLDTIPEITPLTLAALGVGQLEQRNAVIANARVWVFLLIRAGEYPAASAVARRTLQSNLDQVDRLQVSELYLSLAFISLKGGRLWEWIIALSQAVRARPVLVGRPLKPLLRKLGLV